MGDRSRWGRPPNPRPGRPIDEAGAALALGGYRTLLKLASGGMGVVYVARHAAARGVERLVVVKRIHPHLIEDREIAGMLVDEARNTSQIRHPNVVPVDDAVESGGELLLVQPFIESVDLSTLLKAAARAGELLPPAAVSRVVGDALAGLDGAHRAVDLRGRPLELVHRDVSPHNVLVGTDGRSRIIDFGIARAARRITVTRSGVLKGKVSYMAPEHLRRQPIDGRADVFSAGVMLYEALAGRRPFEGDDEADTLLAILMGEPEPLSTVAPGVPPATDAVVERALARDREGRFADAAEMAEALERAIPPAAPREVAALVERLCGASIAARRERIREALDALDEEASALAVSREAAPAGGREAALARDGEAAPTVDREGATLAARAPLPSLSTMAGAASTKAGSDAAPARATTYAKAAGVVLVAGVIAALAATGKSPPPAPATAAIVALTATAPTTTATAATAATAPTSAPPTAAPVDVTSAAPPTSASAPRPTPSAAPRPRRPSELHKNPYAPTD